MDGRLLIIGGGIVGLGIGWQMAKAGADVVLFEARKPGRGASWAAAGILSAHLQADDLLDPLTRFQRHSQTLWPAFAAELEDAAGITVGLRREGVILLASAAEDAAACQRLVASPRGTDRGFRWLDPAALLEMAPAIAPAIAGGLLSRFDHHVDNRRVMKALRRAFETAGGTLRTGEPVRRILSEGEAVVAVETEAGQERGNTVVLAAGAWSGGIAGLPPSLTPPVVPISGQMLALAMDPTAPLCRHAILTGAHYLVPRDGGTLLVGATSEARGFDARHTAAGLALLLAALPQAMPAALELPVAESWVGFRPGTPDHRPILGRCGLDGLIFATGHGHNGILMAPATIEAICVQLVSGQEDPTLLAFGIERFH